jgi:glycosyltransferase involved in cell wall biosynthesis
MAGVPQRVTLVLGASAGGMGAHVRMLATGFADRGIAVSVIGPASAGTRLSFSAVPTASFATVEILERPRARDLAGMLRLRRLLLDPAPTTPHGAPDDENAGAHVAHAHGLRAGALTVLALLLAPRSRRPAVVVSVHNAPPDGGRAVTVYRLLERVVARGADLVLCVSPDLDRRMRAAGAQRVDRAVIAASGPSFRPTAADAAPALSSPAAKAAPPPVAAATPVPAATRVPATPVPATPVPATRQAAGDPASEPPQALPSAGRPVVLAVGRLATQKDFGVLLEAAATWRDLDPVPQVAIAGEGPLAGRLSAQAAELGVDALFLGHRDDVPPLLAAAAVFVLPSRWEGQPLVLQEALRAGAAIVATRVGGVPGMTGEDAALLIPPGDARALATAVRSVLTDPSLAARLRTAAVVRAANLPSEVDAITAALAAYAEVRHREVLR